MIKKIIEFPLTWLAEKYVKNPGGFANLSTVFLFTLLPGLQALAMKRSDKIPEEQKKYLIDQTLAEGAANVGILFTTNLLLTKAGTELVGRAKILPELPKKLVEFIQNTPDRLNKIVKAEKFNKNLLKHDEFTSEVFDKIKKFQKGMEVTGAFLGILFASSILIPIAINKFAQSKTNEANKLNIIPAVKTLTKPPQKIAIPYNNGFKQSTFKNFSSGLRI